MRTHIVATTFARGGDDIRSRHLRVDRHRLLPVLLGIQEGVARSFGLRGERLCEPEEWGSQIADILGV
jgi:hypothetical protein